MTLADALATGESFRNPDFGNQFLIPVGSGYIVSGTSGPFVDFSLQDMARTDWETIVSAEPTPLVVDIPAPEPILTPKKGKS